MKLLPLLLLLAAPPDVRLESAFGGARSLAAWRGRVVVLVYEDKDASDQNAALKRELAPELQGARDAAVVPVADLRGFDFFPASSFARRAVQGVAHANRAEVLIDWKGALGNAYRLPRGQSAVLLLDRAGEVRYRHLGALDGSERRRFFDELHRLRAEAP